MKSQRSTYRKEDFERLKSPEQLDQLLTVTTPKSWLALLAAFIIVVASGLWGFGGRVKDTIPGRCILISSGGVQQINFQHAGQITDIRPQPGEFVRRGEVIARLDQPQLVEQIAQLQNELETLTDGPEHLTRKEQLTEDIEHLRTLLEQQSRLVSPYDGRVLQLRANTLEFVQPGDPLLTLELAGGEFKELEAVIYLPVDSGQIVHAGMPVEIVPNTVRKEEYGFMTGWVTSVSEFPVVPEDILRVVGSQELVQHLIGSTPSIEVRADLAIDPSTASGYAWSSSEGPYMKLNAGTLCNAAVTTGERSPFSLLFGN